MKPVRRPSAAARVRAARTTPTTPGRTAAVVRSTGRSVQERRRRFLLALRELDEAWVESFHETGFSDVYFSRLFTELWLRGGEPVAKTDAYGFVKGVGVQTAMKYVRRAIDEGYLLEFDNPADGRSKLIGMSPDLRVRFEALMDRGVVAFGVAFGTED
jgi:hypothetical protein